MARLRCPFAGLWPRIATGALIILFAALASASLAGPRPAYNVILITLDTTRADHLGVYGYRKPTSAVLDGFASEAAVFEMGISQAALTPVSHASILTGLYPYHHRLRLMHGLVENVLPENQTTLAEVWRSSGGQTAAFISAYPAGSAFGLQQGFSKFDDTFPHADGEGLVDKNGVVNTGKSQRRADATTDAALRWMKGFQKNDKPFLMWVHYFDPHDAYILPPRTLTDSLMYGALAPAGNDDASIGRAMYDCDVYYMDRQIGRLFAELKRRNLWDRTIVVVVGDHGEGLGDHNWWTHGILYQEQIRVPYIVRVPRLPAGRRIASLVRSIDLMPTILEAAEIPPAAWPKMDGESLVRTIRTGATDDSLVAYSGAVNICMYARPDKLGELDEKTDKLYCLMNARYKFIYHQLVPQESELYDLSVDPKELRNLYEKSSPIVTRLLKDLRARRAITGIMPGMTPADLERMRRLESLGYIN